MYGLDLIYYHYYYVYLSIGGDEEKLWLEEHRGGLQWTHCQVETGISEWESVSVACDL